MMARKSFSSKSEAPRGPALASRTSETQVSKKEEFHSPDDSRPNGKSLKASSGSKDGSPNDSGELYDRIARKAYELFSHRGQQHGLDKEDWFEAERQVLGKEYQKEAATPRGA